MISLDPNLLLQKLDVRVRDPDLARSVTVPIHDPLWMLTRQAQFGELEASDAGTPIAVRVEGESNTLALFEPRGTDATSRGTQPIDPRSMPLEAAVERDPELSDHALSAKRIEMGLEVQRLLRDHGIQQSIIANMRRVFRFRVPGAANRALDVTLRTHIARSIDGGAILAAVSDFSAREFLEEFSVPSDRIESLAAALELWRERSGVGSSEAGAWHDKGQDYRFAVAAPDGVSAPLVIDIPPFDPIIGPPIVRPPLGGQPELPDVVSPEPIFPPPASRTAQTVLAAHGYRGGRLDWYDFTVEIGHKLGRIRRPAPKLSQTVIPSPVTFEGMPLPRWWSVEPGGTNWGFLDPAPEDLARLIVSDFALSYGGDWMVIPLNLTAGSVTRFEQVRVRDSFGRVSTLAPVSDSTSRWAMWRLGSTERTPNANGSRPFFLAPTLPPHLIGDAIEDVSFHRDESANLVWAIERRARDPLTGSSLDRDELAARLSKEPVGRSLMPGTFGAYQIGTPVPSHWIPFVYEPNAREQGTDGRLLERTSLLNSEAGHVGQSFGSVLTPPLEIHDEEVPREGARVTRHVQRVRWSNGSVQSWIGREKRFGDARDGDSGLRYDVIRFFED